MNDNVKHPKHYTSLGAKCECGNDIECISVAQHMPYNRGAAVMYLWRCGLKGDAIEDLQKAKQYIDFEIERLSSAK